VVPEASHGTITTTPRTPVLVYKRSSN